VPSQWHSLIRDSPYTPANWRDEVRRGGFPEPALTIEGETARTDWFEGYSRTYLERDLRDLSAVETSSTSVT
jgi:predicted AAA+ superfamily ATPase